MNKRISGKKIAELIKEDLKKEISVLPTEIIFSIIYVGSNPIIDNFIKYKQKFGKDIGVKVNVHHFEENISQEVLLEKIDKLALTSDALIVQLPLPEHLSVNKILNAIPLEKDVDVLGVLAKKTFADGSNTMMPPVTGAMIIILEDQKYELFDKNVAIVGYGNLVGKPFGVWLSQKKIIYDIIHKNTNDFQKQKILKEADLIVSGAGSPGLITAEMIKQGVVLLDGGTSETGKKVIGDIHPDCYEKSLFYTPVPGGIGPLTIAVLYQNILKAKKNKTHAHIHNTIT